MQTFMATSNPETGRVNKPLLYMSCLDIDWFLSKVRGETIVLSEKINFDNFKEENFDIKFINFRPLSFFEKSRRNFNLRNDVTAFKTSFKMEPRLLDQDEKQCRTGWTRPCLPARLFSLGFRHPCRGHSTNRPSPESEEVMGHGPGTHQASTDEPVYHVSNFKDNNASLILCCKNQSSKS
jgi:hypothetical protein